MLDDLPSWAWISWARNRDEAKYLLADGPRNNEMPSKVLSNLKERWGSTWWEAWLGESSVCNLPLWTSWKAKAKSKTQMSMCFQKRTNSFSQWRLPKTSRFKRSHGRGIYFMSMTGLKTLIELQWTSGCCWKPLKIYEYSKFSGYRQ